MTFSVNRVCFFRAVVCCGGEEGLVLLMGFWAFTIFWNPVGVGQHYKPSRVTTIGTFLILVCPPKPRISLFILVVKPQYFIIYYKSILKIIFNNILKCNNVLGNFVWKSKLEENSNACRGLICRRVSSERLARKNNTHWESSTSHQWE